MNGRVLGFDGATGVGTILGDDGARYRFDRAASRARYDLQAGDAVEFTADADRQVTEVDLAPVAPIPPRPAAGRSLDVGRVLQRTFASISQNWAVFLGGAVVLVGLPGLVSAWGQNSALSGDPMSALGASFFGGVFTLIGTYILQGMVVHATVSGFNGRRIDFGEALGTGAQFFLPLLGLAILSTIAITLGYLLLIVPGVILTVLWLVAAPALVVERKGIFASLQRSRDLTRGSRWPIFGVVVIYIVVWVLIGAVVGGLTLATGGGVGAGSGVVNLIVTPLTNIFSGVLAAAGVAAVYYELRTVKEGVGAEQLAAVFD